MAYVSLKKMPERIASLTPFEGNSVKAEWRNGYYVILSYSTVIAEVVGGKVAYLNNGKFSVTTSKHQNYIRQGLSRFEVHPDAVVINR
jgi:hypothetical protein